MLCKLKKELQKHARPSKAKIYQRFFKTGKGEYGEGDIFMGLTMPNMRSIAAKYYGLGIPDLQKLLNSKIHEHRMVGLIILVEKHKKAYEKEKKLIYNFYLKNFKRINNWDLVDVTAPHILGMHMLENKEERKRLYTWARSKHLWTRRISIISCFAFIRNKDFKDALKISEMLLKDKHDLIHKAVGWMLREIGKKDQKVLESFLKKHYKKMPRTMLRYSIERLSEKKRKLYMRK